MILLAHLKFCWHIFNFAGVVLEAKVAPAKDSRQQNLAGKYCHLKKRKAHRNSPDRFVEDFLQKIYLVVESVIQPILLHFWIPLGHLNRSMLSNFI